MLKKLLITGANGNLGAVCRDRLTHIAETVRVSARHGLGEARENEDETPSPGRSHAGPPARASARTHRPARHPTPIATRPILVGTPPRSKGLHGRIDRESDGLRL